MIIAREILEDREQARVHPARFMAAFYRLELVRSYRTSAQILFVQGGDRVVQTPEEKQLGAFVGVRGVVLFRENLHVFCHLDENQSDSIHTSVEYFCLHR